MIAQLLIATKSGFLILLRLLIAVTLFVLFHWPLLMEPKSVMQRGIRGVTCIVCEYALEEGSDGETSREREIEQVPLKIESGWRRI